LDIPTLIAFYLFTFSLVLYFSPPPVILISCSPAFSFPVFLTFFQDFLIFASTFALSQTPLKIERQDVCADGYAGHLVWNGVFNDCVSPELGQRV
jgi:hypothetical protein